MPAVAQAMYSVFPSFETAMSEGYRQVCSAETDTAAKNDRISECLTFIFPRLRPDIYGNPGHRNPQDSVSRRHLLAAQISVFHRDPVRVQFEVKPASG